REKTTAILFRHRVALERSLPFLTKAAEKTARRPRWRLRATGGKEPAYGLAEQTRSSARSAPRPRCPPQHSPGNPGRGVRKGWGDRLSSGSCRTSTAAADADPLPPGGAARPDRGDKSMRIAELCRLRQFRCATTQLS